LTIPILTAMKPPKQLIHLGLP